MKKKTKRIMLMKNFGRMELATRYFPTLCPRAAWHKLKLLLQEYPELSRLATMSRRSFTAREADDIFTLIGEPG
jgi:hypothetical protein